MPDIPVPWFAGLGEATACAVASSPTPFSVGVSNGSMRLGLYAPRGHDPQQPHSQDEIHVVVQGHGEFVPAAMSHRFENFSDDLLVSVVCDGSGGGETGFLMTARRGPWGGLLP